MGRRVLNQHPLRDEDKLALVGSWVITTEGRVGRLLCYCGTAARNRLDQHAFDLWDVRWRNGELGLAIRASTLELLHPLEVLALDEDDASMGPSRVDKDNTTGGAR